MSTIKAPLPSEVLATLWSYDSAKLDPILHRKLIISAVLNYGTKAATDWLFAYYGATTLKQVAEKIPRGTWDKRSLALWSTVLGIHPKTRLELMHAQ
jgi:hypothetical protein